MQNRLTDVRGVIGAEVTPHGLRPVILETEVRILLDAIARRDTEEAAAHARTLAHRLRLVMGWAKF